MWPPKGASSWDKTGPDPMPPLSQAGPGPPPRLSPAWVFRSARPTCTDLILAIYRATWTNQFCQKLDLGIKAPPWRGV